MREMRRCPICDIFYEEYIPVCARGHAREATQKIWIAEVEPYKMQFEFQADFESRPDLGQLNEAISNAVKGAGAVKVSVLNPYGRPNHGFDSEIIDYQESLGHGRSNS